MFTVKQGSIKIATSGRDTYDVTRQVNDFISRTGVSTGLVHVFVLHTSASLMLCENADPDVRHDLETFMSDLVPDEDGRYRHQSEGPDDMPAHIRSVLTQSGLQVPIKSGKCLLGTWQGLYLWEHRTQPHQRKLSLTVMGHEPVL